MNVPKCFNGLLWVFVAGIFWGYYPNAWAAEGDDDAEDLGTIEITGHPITDPSICFNNCDVGGGGSGGSGTGPFNPDAGGGSAAVDNPKIPIEATNKTVNCTSLDSVRHAATNGAFQVYWSAHIKPHDFLGSSMQPDGITRTIRYGSGETEKFRWVHNIQSDAAITLTAGTCKK